MTSKIAKAAMAGAHTAGIFADMTVDGPIIGDLVINIDRAKNLPNRKTMGKQNPYCAARLGKDAQKTPTDKRGGQTPKWDHEMRFTVHDSPDYHSLKVSVFNDDKKTDLIGETWLSLDEVLNRGGGDREGWNNLNFKGRYAGEIWIELTYFDTRPREEKAATPESNGAQATPSQDRSSESLAGPRQLQPKPVKRRPLPADPINGVPPTRPSLLEHSHSSPLPNPPARTSGRLHGPASHAMHEPRHHSQPALPPPEDLDSMPKSVSQPQPSGYNEPPQRLPDELHFEPVHPLWDNRPQKRHSAYEYSSGTQYNGYGGEYTGEPEPVMEPESQPQYNGFDLPELPPHTPRHQQQASGISPRQHSQYEGNSSSGYALPYYESAEPQFQGQEYDQRVVQSIEGDDGPPPPPPAHRSANFGASPRESPSSQSLHGRQMRTSISASPLAQHIASQEEDDDFYSPAETQLSTRSAPNMPYEHHEQPRRYSDRSSEMPSYHNQRSQGHPSVYGDSRALQQDVTPNGPVYSTPPHRGRQAPEHRYSVPPENDQYWNNSGSAPMVKPRAISPQPPAPQSEPRRPLRKSVSPHPPPMTGPPSTLSSIPFSPDSYDQLNPNLKKSSINTPSATYTNAEHARRSAREREKEDELAKGPIIDNKGKIIDPSDHLPSDTWAPEPEPKPRKTHQINIRFKHGPRAAPPTRENPTHIAREARERDNGRPYSYSTSSVPTTSAGNSQPSTPHQTPPRAPPSLQHAYTENDVSPPTNSSGRNRLQKKHPASGGGWHSSPLVPSVHSSPAHTNPHTPVQASPLGRGPPSAQGYSPSPLREREPNYGTHAPSGYSSGPQNGYGSYGPGGNSPYGGGNMRGGPPPVPAKIPMHAGGGGQEDWNLNDEIGRIDLGSFEGTRRGRGGRMAVKDI